MEENEDNYNNMLKNEVSQWEIAINKLKKVNEKELQRK